LQRNLAARAGRWSAQHRKLAVFGWLALVIAALAIGSATGQKSLTTAESLTGDSGRAATTVEDSFPKKAEESVLVQSSKLKATDSEFRAVVADVERRLGARSEVTGLQSPYERENAGQISEDGRSVLVQFDVKGDENQAEERVDGSLAATAAVQAQHRDFRVEQFGAASANKALSKVFEDDLRKAETISLPLTMIILLVAFGALVAAGLPLLLGLTAVMAAIGLLGPVSQLLPVTDAIGSVVLLIGLAVGVDYSLFYIRREREERRAGKSEEAALEAAAATSGRAVLISGLTVMIAMAGMFITGDKTFASMAAGTILVVAVAMVGSVTVLPALLSKLGDRIDKGRVPFIGRRMAQRTESRAWSWILDRVLRRPVVSAVTATVVLLALAAPVLGMQTATSGIDDLPRSIGIMQTYDRIQASFPGGQIPATVVVKANDVMAPEVQGAIKDLRDEAIASGHFNEPVSTEVSPNGRVEVVSLPIQGNGNDDASQAALASLRDEVIPSTVDRAGGTETLVGGLTAESKDFNDLVKSNIVYVFGFVLGLAFLLLLVTFRSIVIPIKAIVLNLLSVGAAYGVLTLVFQHGWGNELIGQDATGPIVSWLPLFLFVVLFGLSMDYHVFILSRVREAFDRGMSTDDAVAYGIKATAGVVTSAAVVMVGVFGVFVTLTGVDLKQMGVGLAVAVLIDATIVRAVLLPATMKLLGDWNWYLPKRLHWLPKFAHEPAVEPARA
jgi:uncharacterized membrane protein YdfJ with MMPL/SSD domain